MVNHSYSYQPCRYCVAGTVGHKLMSGKPTRIDLDKDTHIDVRCQVAFQLILYVTENCTIFKK